MIRSVPLLLLALAEDTAEAAWHRDHSRANLRAWRMATEGQRTTSLRLHRSLMFEEGR